MSKRLPDVFCEREMMRYWWTPGLREGLIRHRDEDHEDVVTARVVYKDGHEYYADLHVNGKVVDIPLSQLPGSWSDGEFATILQGLFLQAHAEFEFKKEEVLRSTRVFVFQFTVHGQDNKSYFLQAENQNWFPDYHGELWLDKTTFRLLRLERETAYMPKRPITRMKTRIDYSEVLLRDGSRFDLPINSEVVICSFSEHENTDKCSRNVIKFVNWKKFGITTNILMSPAH